MQKNKIKSPADFRRETVRCYFTANSSDVKTVKHSKKDAKKINECFDWWEKESNACKITEAQDEQNKKN